MARGRKAYTLEEQLEKITNEITNMENSLKELKQRKKELEDRVNQSKLVMLYDIINEKGLTLDEVRQMLENRES